MKRKNKGTVIGRFLFHICIALLAVLTFSLKWAKDNYGNIGFEEIVFHLNMPLKGTAESLLLSYAKNALIPAVIIWIVWLVFYYWPSRDKAVLEINVCSKMFSIQLFPFRVGLAGNTLIVLCCTALLFSDASASFGFFEYIKNQLQQSTLIEEEYVDPAVTKITFPEEKRNLITIYLESAETSNQDKASGGYFDVNVIPELTEIAKTNISFSQSDLIEGACVAPACGWTIAALVAQTAGLPLKLYSYADQGVDNTMNKYQSFMPGATTLGDILEEQGYHNYIMVGSNLNFGGRKTYFKQHGDYGVWEYITAIRRGLIDSDYKVWWGFEDQKLYSYAKIKLLELAEEGGPFNFSMLTVDTHHPDGYVCEICPDTYEDQYSNVWACASAQVAEFLDWLKEQEFYENTTVVIAGDHCSMDVDYYDELSYDKHIGETERKVYNAFINSAVEPVNEKNRKFTTLDMFPTVLASIGAEIEGNRLGLGTNLFSEEETLSEKYGYEYLFAELNKKSSFYNNEILFP